MNMKKNVFILFLLALLSFNAANAQQNGTVVSYKPGWHKIAEKTVDFKADRDQLTILGSDKFKAIQLKTTDARIHLESLSIVYDLPGVTEEFKEDISVRNDFKPGERTRIIYLKYPCLKINKVVFVYGTVPNWKVSKAHIDIYALK